MLLHAPLPPTSPQPPEEPPLPEEDEEFSSKESEYESSDDEDRQRFVESKNVCRLQGTKSENEIFMPLVFLYFFFNKMLLSEGLLSTNQSDYCIITFLQLFVRLNKLF